MEWGELAALFAGTAEGEGWLERLRRHWALTREHPEAGRLTAVEDEGEAVRRHYAESLELVRLAEEAGIPRAGVRSADVGTGGGWPGLAVACVRPGWEVHLVEPLGKRAAFLSAAAAEL
ncbi:RsmG family class I SAM-dependent methyltransferase, partial [Tepidiforma sp.]|uniref:RsmG family class I SAM-dependent methyltransferase n=1 Tax=Tepidiforma sp. TaxID=2682230 RepID=UPI002ADDE941